MGNAESLTKQTLILMIGKTGGLMISFILPLIIVRLTDQEGFGTYKQFFLIFSTLFLLEQLGMTQSLYYFVPGNERSDVFVTQSFLFLLTMGLFSAFSLYFLGPKLAKLLNNPMLSQYAPLLAAYLLFQLGSSLLEVLTICEGRIKLASLFFFLTELFKSLFMLVPLYFSGTLLALFWGAVGFALLRFMATTLYIGKSLQSGLKKVTRESLRCHLSYAFPLGMSMVFFVVSLDLHSYVVSYNFPPEVYAIFAVGIFYPPIVEVIESPIIEPMFVSMVKFAKSGDSRAVNGVWFSSIRKISLVFFPVVAFSAVEARQIITVLFTEAYLASVPIFMIAIFRVFFAVFIPDNVIKTYGQPHYLLVVNIISLLCYGAALFLFIHTFGLLGAAFAMIINEIVLKTLLVNRARKILELPLSACLPWSHLIRCFVIAFISTAVVYLYNQIFSTITLTNTLIALLIYLFVYSAVVWKSSLVTSEEKDAILVYLRQKRLLPSNG